MIMSNREAGYRSNATRSVQFMDGLIEKGTRFVQGWFAEQHLITRQVMVGAVLVTALFAFELFNFDTTEYALEDLLGPTSFAGIRWATILAIAFCSIDIAGLARLIMPDTGREAEGGRFLKPAWLMLGAWLLGGAVNAIMTWWAVSLALMGHSLGNEVLTREQLLRIVPIFVALLVWVTRVLIISSFTMTADRVPAGAKVRRRPSPRERKAPSRQISKPTTAFRVKPEPVSLGDDDLPPSRPNNRPPNRKPQRPRAPRPMAQPIRASGASRGDRTQM
jgi:hypothetical protein